MVKITSKMMMMMMIGMVYWLFPQDIERKLTHIIILYIIYIYIIEII